MFEIVSSSHHLNYYLYFRILVFAATDTTTSALTQTFHLIAQHPEVQDKLRNEIKEAKLKAGGENIPHDELMALPYLDAVCRETLRL